MKPSNLSARILWLISVALLAAFFAIKFNQDHLSAAGAPDEPAYVYNSRVAQMMARVTQNLVYTATAQLSGGLPVIVAGRSYTITDRYSNAGRNLVATYLYQYARSFGASVSYDSYRNTSALCPSVFTNVVATFTGVVTPTEIVLLTAHFDSYASGVQAADDNASGSAGVMLAVRAFRDQTFARTLRLIWFDGEERDLCGSGEYAWRMSEAGQNLVAVFNMDMIGYDSDSDGVMELHTRESTSAGYAGDHAIAVAFTNVVPAYGLSSVLQPVLRADGADWSDHWSFWDRGFAAVCAIEDDTNDSNPYYHSPSDTQQRLNLSYQTSYIKAVIGTIAHLAIPASRAFIPAATRP